jgi:uncharacterized protein (DUF1919 family)
MRLLKHLEYYLSQPLKFIDTSKYKDRPKTYPIAMLDDIELHFSHYPTEEKAAKKWHRRTARLLEVKDKNRWFFIISDRERVDEDLIHEFHSLAFSNKISFGAKPIKGLSPQQHIHTFKQFYRNRKEVFNGKKMFKTAFLYFDIDHWLNTGEVKRTKFRD